MKFALRVYSSYVDSSGTRKPGGISGTNCMYNVAGLVIGVSTPTMPDGIDSCRHHPYRTRVGMIARRKTGKLVGLSD